jgi:hypothetical protein
MFTWILVTAVAATAVAVVIHEIRSWRKPGRTIPLNAPMDSQSVNDARHIHGTNIHKDSNGIGGF